MIQRIKILSIALLPCLFTQALPADQLLIDTIESAPINSEEGISRPTRGMTMDQVSTRFGAPLATYPSVGNPPITRWDYANYSVFFEYDHVLTSVMHH
jgi:outer membrane protein assembly factor BamE (lipoprotein component of BamABCDE complex)